MSRARAIGCDGGGSGARLALVWDGLRHEVCGGPANVTSDFAGAVAEVSGLLHRAAQLAGVSLEDLRGVPAHFALAGVVDERVATRVAAALPLEGVVEEDRRAAVRGALGERPGHVAGIGTGSYLARQGPDGFETIGGHGLVLGDEASGAWMGRALLKAVLAVEDGVEPATALTRQIAEEMGGVSGIVAFAAEAGPSDFAALAPRLLDAKTDSAARHIIVAGADYIARGLLALGWKEGGAICLIGGIGGKYADFLPTQMQKALVGAEGSALDGALALAMEQDG
ncbi:ATPase [Oceanicola sp. D3]|uniref:BadF/BadG/BcrA/BcrD ATPase family protein n=1 Tax=Oceanicola sp. D3 TaxID=2587163 RepID=UPI00111CEE61|nr:BadF/BadG/BcrA/BcrD ATPase family protein [Oceanicola sp. D3]QDC08086.1 ATPase [Oceanicola sp. D3]